MNFTPAERRKINEAERARVLRDLTAERDAAREERAGLAIQLGMMITERNELRRAFDERSQALTRSGDALMRAENERDALRDMLRRVDNIVRGFDSHGLYAGNVGAKVAALLESIPAPDLGGNFRPASKADDSWLKNRTGFVRP